MKTPTIRQLKEMHTKFCGMSYPNGPILAINGVGVHFDEDFATEYAPLECWKVEPRKCDIYPIEISAIVNGLKMYAVMTTEHAKELGFVKDEEIEQ